MYTSELETLFFAPTLKIKLSTKRLSFPELAAVGNCQTLPRGFRKLVSRAALLSLCLSLFLISIYMYVSSFVDSSRNDDVLVYIGRISLSPFSYMRPPVRPFYWNVVSVASFFSAVLSQLELYGELSVFNKTEGGYYF